MTDANPYAGMTLPEDASSSRPLDSQPLPQQPHNPYAGMNLPEDSSPDHAAIAGAKIRQSPLSPDQYAEASTLGQQIGVPAPVVARNLDQSRQIKQNQDLRQFAEAHAAGALWLAQGDHAALSHDDLDAMGRISTAGQAISTGGRIGRALSNAGEAVYTTGQDFAANIVEAASVIPKLAGAMDGLFSTDMQDSVYKAYADPMMAYADALKHSPGSAAHPTAAAVGDVGGTLAQYFLLPGAEGVKVADTAAPWIAKFAADPRVQGFLAHVAQFGVENLPRAGMVTTAHSSAAATRQAQAGVPLSEQYKDYAVSLPVGTAANSVIPAIPGGKIVRAISGEGIGLALNAIQQAIEHAVAPDAVGPVQAPDFTNPATLLPAALAVLFGSRGTHVEPPPAKIEAAAQALDSMTHTPDRVETSLHNAEQLHQVMEAASQSKLATRSPETLASFVHATADHTVYLPVDAVDEHFTSQGLDPATEVAAITEGDHRGYHRPVTLEGGAATLDDLTPAFGKDVYSKNAAKYFGDGSNLDKETIGILASVRGKPDEIISVYRAIPSDQPSNDLKYGDWITVNKKYAEQHGESALEGKYRIVEQKVRVGDITGNADSIHEQGYHPQNAIGTPATDAYARAKETGTLAIPLADYAVHGQELHAAVGEHAKLDEGGLAPSEVPDAIQTHHDVMDSALQDHQDVIAQAVEARDKADLGFAVRGAENTSGKNAVTEAEAERDGMLRTFSDASLGNKELLNGAMETAARHPFAGLNLTADLLANRRPISDKEVSLLTVDRARIHNDAAIARATARNKEGKTDSQQAADLVNLERVEQQRRDNDLAFRQSGTDNSGGLRARQMVISLDFKLETMLQDMEIARGGRLSPKVTAKTEKIAKEVEHIKEQMVERDAAAETAKASTKAPKGPKKTIDERMQERFRAEIAKLDAEIHERLKACPV